MELKIRNGDYVALENGGMETVDGSAELIQRVLYRLTARREGFPFIPTLGSTLHQLGRVSARERTSAAEAAVREALREEAELDVAGVTLENAAQGLYTLRIALRYKGDPIEVALTIQ